MRTPIPVRALLVVFGVLTLAFPLAFLSQFFITRHLLDVNGQIARVRASQVAAVQLLGAQVDEETGIRGYQLERDDVLLEPYRSGTDAFPRLASDLRANIDGLPVLAPLGSEIDAVVAINGRWQREVALPAISGERRRDLIDRGKGLIDDLRGHVAVMESRLGDLLRTTALDCDRTIVTDELLGYGSALIFLCEVTLFAILLSSLRRALDRERAIVNVLQATTGGMRHPAFEIGSAYASATRGSRVGGDLFDVFGLDDGAAMVALGDVSGKGVGAAVEAATVRDVLRAYAFEARDPAEVVTRLNALYVAERRPPEAFVTLFVGVADGRRERFTYTSAGHEAAYVRRPSGVEWLPPTDGVIGIDGAARFGSRTVALGPRDLVVLATDGVTEARRSNGAFLADGVVREWIAASKASTPQQLVDDLVARVHAWTRGRAADDLAILAFRPRPQLRS